MGRPRPLFAYFCSYKKSNFYRKILHLIETFLKNSSLGDIEQLHCYELSSKMTLRPFSGYPMVGYY